MLTMIYFVIASVLMALIHAEILEDTGKSVSNYAELTKSNRFVDKTRFIKWFAEQNQSVYITAPRRFGKSTNLDMLQRFFEIPVDEKGHPIKKETSQNYKIFTQPYFFNRSHLAIFRDTAFFDTNFGRWPVLKLNFTYLDTGTFDGFLKSVALTLRKSSEGLKFLQTSSYVTNETRAFMEQLLSKRATPCTEEEAVQFLSQLKYALEAHFNKTCLLLIDGFDSPLQAMLATHGFGRDQKAIFHCLQKLIKSLFQKNYRGLCVGSLPLTGVFPLSEINMRQISFHSNPKVASFFGSTAQEAEFLLQQCSPSINIKTATTLFGGHVVRDPNEESNSSVELFCTYAVRNYCRTGQMAPHSRELFFPLLENLFKITDLTSAMLDLLIGYPYDIPYRKTPQLMDYIKLEVFIDKARRSEGEVATVPKLTVDFLLQLFLEFGYFSVKNTSASVVTLAIPNLEIEEGLANHMYSWVNSFYKIDINTTDAYVKSAKALGQSTESQQHFVNSVAALFSKVGEEPCHQRSLVTPIVLFLITPRSEFVVFPTVHRSSTLFICRTFLGRRTGFVITIAYDRGSGFASKEITWNELTSFLESLKVGFIGEVDFMLGRLDFTPDVLMAAFVYNVTNVKKAKEYSCNIRESNTEAGGNDTGGWGILKQIWKWSRNLG